MITTFAPHAKQVWFAFLDLFLPTRCLRCGEILDATVGLCHDCWQPLTFLQGPCCQCCGLPFASDIGEAGLCAACIAKAPAFAQARAALLYNDHSSPLILAFKYNDRTDAAMPFAQWMASAGHTLLERAEVIIPVPLHWTRLVKRRYNQAALLAHSLSKLSGVPNLPHGLKRIKPTPKLGRLSPSQRKRLLAGAFDISKAASAHIEGKTVLLVDDVYTTGSTLEACSKILLAAGASQVLVLTLCRRLRSDVSGLQVTEPSETLTNNF